MIGSLKVMHKLTFIIPSIIQISSINSNRLRFNLRKPRLFVNWNLIRLGHHGILIAYYNLDLVQLFPIRSHPNLQE